MTSLRHHITNSNQTKIDQTRQTETQQFLSNWIAENKNDYIAHAIWEDNVNGVLTSGSLNPAEFQLRQTGKVSFEESSTYGGRAVRDISRLVKEFKENIIDLPKRVTLENNMSLDKALELNFIDDDTFAKCRKNAKIDEPYFIKLKDGKEYLVKNYKKKVEYSLEIARQFCYINKADIQKIVNERPSSYPRTLFNSYDVTYHGDNITLSYEESKFEIQGIPSLAKHIFGAGVIPKQKNYFDLLEELRIKYNCTDSSIQIVLDMLSESPIDKTLAMLWERYKELVLTQDYRKIAIELNNYREMVINGYKLNSDVRVGYNGIWWNYGDVVALAGHTEQTLSVMSKARYDSDLGKKLENVKIRNGQEVFLLQPYENSGKFYSWDLAKEGTILIGPQQILKKFQEQAHVKGIRLLFIEDMNKDQLEFFQIPIRLQAQKIAGAEKVYSFLEKINRDNTSRFFQHWHTHAQTAKKAEEAKDVSDQLKVKDFRETCDKHLMKAMFNTWSHKTRFARFKKESIRREINEEKAGLNCLIM